MKTIIGAIALIFAVPASAQSAPGAGPQAPHEGSMDHSKHQQGKHDCKECCEKMKGKDGKMECMDMKGDAKPASTDASAHEGHASH
ncbi:hypothetical protein G7076_01920 [Sphingomonas sp. HDW15A]|uniref:hypothetical protein n=1 Tax=Sphingomonas sp. HDW15A TaxID=2714942 RepID=UPI00140CC743|nr:hypothetical protein [Sphingomonas sp. HDW15A]QIK95407.1 hypothetical protein G7076_01920 [Sphingomonas sp. HDW15A]